MCSVRFWKRLELKLHLVPSLLESLSRSLFPPLFPLLLKGLLELVFPLFLCSLHVSSSFFCFILSAAEGSWFVFCSLFVIRHFSQVCAFVLWRFCVALAVARNWTEPSCQSQSHGECSAKHQHHTACKSPKMLPWTKEGKQKHRGFFFFSHLYTNMHLNCLVSSHTT